MQFLAARSLCTNLLLAKYTIPLATSEHIVTRVFRDTSCGIMTSDDNKEVCVWGVNLGGRGLQYSWPSNHLRESVSVTEVNTFAFQVVSDISIGHEG